MKKSIYTAGLVSLAISLFSANALADGVTKVYLSTTPIHVNTHTHYAPHRVSAVQIQHKRWVKPSKRKRVTRARKVRANTKYLRKNFRNIKKSKARKKVIVIKNIRHKPQVSRCHYVKRGDTLSKIAKRYNVTVKHIMRINNLRTTVIKVGRSLMI